MPLGCANLAAGNPRARIATLFPPHSNGPNMDLSFKPRLQPGDSLRLQTETVLNGFQIVRFAFSHRAKAPV